MDARRLILAAALAAAACGLASAQTPGDRILEIVALEDARSTGDGRLEAFLLDRDHEVRRRAVLALGRIGRPEAIPALLRSLEADVAGAVRTSAAFALGILEDPLPEDAALALAAALGDRSDRVRERALESLGRRGGPGAAELVANVLAEQVEAADYAERRENIEVALRRTAWDGARLSLFSLARIRDDGGDPGDVLPLLGSAGAPRTDWWPAVWTAARLRDPSLAPLGRAWAGSADPLTRALGLRVLGGTGLDAAAEAAPHVTHANEIVRIEAMRAMASLAGGRPIRGAERLLEALSDSSWAVRAEAVAALASVPVDGSAPLLVDLVADADPALRAAAARAIHLQDPETFWLLLAGWSDRDPLARIAMTRAMGGVADPRIRNFLLYNGLADEDARVRAAAMTALAALETGLADDQRDPEVTTAVAGGLAAADPLERAAAANALRRLGDGLVEIRRAFDDDGEDEVSDFRLAALRAVLELDSGPSRQAFAELALTDRWWPVRREAHRFLRGEGLAPPPPAPAPAQEPAAYAPTALASFTPLAWIDTDYGEIELELLVGEAPRTVLNFVTLARQGFYDGLTFHRVVPNFVVQAGDPRNDMAGGPGYAIRCEMNPRRYVRGTVGMALDGKDTGGSQFFITLLPQPHLNGRHTVFGQVRSGFPILDRLGPGDVIRGVRIWDGVIPPE